MATLNYRDMPIIFQIRKVVRYVELYGVSRTFEKVASQMHAGAKADFPGKSGNNPAAKLRPGRTIGMIGCGSFAYSTIAYYLRRDNRHYLKAAMDPDAARARSLVQRFGGQYATTDAQMVLDDPDIDLVYVASRNLEGNRAMLHAAINRRAG